MDGATCACFAPSAMVHSMEEAGYSAESFSEKGLLAAQKRLCRERIDASCPLQDTHDPRVELRWVLTPGPAWSASGRGALPLHRLVASMTFRAFCRPICT